jgi:hypothetical protein
VDTAGLIKALSSKLPQNLAQDLISDFVQLRQDVATRTLGGSSGGKVVETVVQCLQHLEIGKYDLKPNIEGYLVGVESRTSSLDDGLRVCAARIARGMYSIRSKRNILHKGEVDTNTFDLNYLFHGTQWLVTELLRNTGSMKMEDAGRLVEMVNAPIETLVQDFGGKRVVLADVETPDEIVLLLHSHYGERLMTSQILASLNRTKEKTVRNALAGLWRKKLVEGNGKEGFTLTLKGFARATQLTENVVK